MGRLCFTESWRREDMEMDVTPTRISARCLVGSMNDVLPFLKFTTEIGEDFPNGRLPSLDTEIWVEGKRKVLFAFYEKPMATNLVVQAKSALSQEVKAATLSEEVVRRLRNTSLELNSTERLEILERACVKMKTSGHSERFIRMSVEKGVRVFKQEVLKSKLPVEDMRYSPLYRKSSWRKDTRAKQKLLKRKTWYADRKEEESFSNTNHRTDMISNDKKIKKIFHKNKNKNKVSPGINTTTVVIVPSTKNGILVRKLKETEEEMAIMSDFRIRFQEAGGSKLSNQFNTNLSHGQHCGRICYPCECN